MDAYPPTPDGMSPIEDYTPPKNPPGRRDFLSGVTVAAIFYGCVTLMIFFASKNLPPSVIPAPPVAPKPVPCPGFVASCPYCRNHFIATPPVNGSLRVGSN